MSAVDADEPSSGHKFFFSLAPEGTYRSNFTVRDNGGEQHSARVNTLQCNSSRYSHTGL